MNALQPSEEPKSRPKIWHRFPWEPFFLLLGALWVVGLDNLLPGGNAVGRPTRDLFDHIALLDAWFLRTPDWNFPSGGSVFPADPTGMSLSLPFSSLGPGAAYSWAVALQLWLSALAAWALGRRYGSGLVAGVAFGLSPYLVGQAMSGESETLCAWPLAGVALLLEKGGRRAAVAAGLLAALGSVSSWYHGVFVATYLTLYIVARRGENEGWRKDGVWALGSFAVAVSIPAGVYASFLVAPDQLFVGPTLPTYLSEHSQALVAMVADPGAWVGLSQEGAPHVDLLGGVIGILAMVGGVSLWREGAKGRSLVRFWSAVIIVSLLLSLGPVLVVRGSQVFDWAPGRLLVDMPIFERMRLTHRWMLPATLGLAVLAARGGRDLPWLFAGMILLETAWFGVPVRPSTNVEAPEIHAHLTGPVLDLPMRTLGDDARGRYLVWQRQHGYPVPYALLMQSWSDEMAEEPLVVAVTALDSGDPIALRSAEARQFRQGNFSSAVGRWQAEPDDARLVGSGERLRAMGLEHVVLHVDLLDPVSGDQTLDLLLRQLGQPRIRTEEALLWDL